MRHRRALSSSAPLIVKARLKHFIHLLIRPKYRRGASPGMDLRSYAYVSRVAISGSDFASAVDYIVTRAVRVNSERGITGVLLSSRGFFCQLVEGPGESIPALIQELQSDPRHREMRVFEDMPTSFRRTAGWALAYSGAPVFLGAMLERLHAGRSSREDVDRLLRLLLQFARQPQRP